jgi:hypothetical protein
MKVRLELGDAAYDDLIKHLLPPGRKREQAAFLFARYDGGLQQARFTVTETRKLAPDDFAFQMGDYLELTDTARAAIIKRAHDLEASLIEVHSHLGPWPAGFSPSDRSGLRETVPHMWWRLKKRPYAAIVVAASGFDALAWIENPNVPRPFDALVAGNRILKPTNHSLGGWK